MTCIKLLSGGGGNRRGGFSSGGGSAWLGTLNYVVKSGAATLANSQIFDNGVKVGIFTAAPVGTFDVRTAVTFFGDSGGVFYINNETINFRYYTNANSSGYINFAGYNNGATQFRDLYICNGKGSAIAMFDGSSSFVGVGIDPPIHKFHVAMGANDGAIAISGKANNLV
jgi:hypothetical protein